jgi:hypothetical protein
MYRLGMTESTLLLFYFFDHVLQCPSSKLYNDQQNYLINWLFSTSGFYDKTVKGNYFDFDAENIKKQPDGVYLKYFRALLNIVRTVKQRVVFNFHKIHPELSTDEFYEYIERAEHPEYDEEAEFLKALGEHKNIVIVNNLGQLMKRQYDTGGALPSLPEFESVDYYMNGYSFLNNGVHRNIFETADSICCDLQKQLTGKQTLVVVSAGAYSTFIAYFLSHKCNKSVFVIGGNLPFYFGIRTNRVVKFFADRIDSTFVTVPESLKPKCHKLIEDSCYW